MTDIEKKYWDLAPFYKGYLPAKEEIEALSYVVIAQAPEAEENSFLIQHDPVQDVQEDLARINQCRKDYGVDELATEDQLYCSHNTNNITVTCKLCSEEGSNAKDSFEMSPVFIPNIPKQKRLLTPQATTDLEKGAGDANEKRGITFFMCKKSELTPPPVKYTLTAKKVNRCFFVCEKANCFCERPHIQMRNQKCNAFWHVRLDTLKHVSILVSDNNQNRRIAANQIIPTAGYYFALGLMATGAVQAVVPTLCRFNHDCHNGALCLYIHADVKSGPVHRDTADVLLSDWASSAHLGDLIGLDDQENFFTFLDQEGITTVGDLQVLGVNAYEALANRIPQQWATAFLVLSLLRSFDHKYPLTDALASFPRVQLPIQFPPTLQRVGDLLAISRKELYQMPSIPPHALDACELIRSRFKTDDEYCVVNLAKEPPESFFVRVTNIIKNFSEEGRNAHFSWRKHDRSRPLVTSVFTYVDVNTCRCGSVPRIPADEEDASVLVSLDPVTDDIGLPPRVWCTCPRHYVVAVNYELSTPSGSRCSEQNAMGKLASLGVPTWCVREVFVYGLNPKKESNPLFPCGVCENMLQKVNADINKHYGNEATLYMFDATRPHKVVYLPVAEISNRNGLNFKTFVAHDLRTSESNANLKA